MARKRGTSGSPVPVFVVGFLVLAAVFRSLNPEEILGEDWPIFVGVTLFILFRALTDSRKSRGPVPMPLPKAPPADGAREKLPFEIPTLKGAPKAREERTRVYQEQPTPEEAAREAEEERERQRKRRRHIEEKQARERAARAREEAEYEAQAKLAPAPPPRQPAGLPLSAAALRNAFLYAEIFAPPKALRRSVKS